MMSVCTNSNVRYKQLLFSEDILKLAPEYYDVILKLAPEYYDVVCEASAVIYCDIVYDAS